MTIDNTLAERGKRYGEFAGHANVTQELKRAMGRHPGWRKLKDDQKEALEMTAHKIGRILNGDPNYIDSWHDIIGYVRLVEQRLEGEQKPVKANPLKEQVVGAYAAMNATQEQTSSPNERMRAGIDRAIAALNKDIQAAKRAAATKAAGKPCDCPACSLEKQLADMFPGADIKVHYMDEDTGRID